MNTPLFLFCGGPAIYDESNPKPLMRIKHRRSLLAYFLEHLERRPSPPASVTLLCDEGQQDAYGAMLASEKKNLPIFIQTCGPRASTLEKFECALANQIDQRAVVRFGYPDIFYFGQEADPDPSTLTQGLVTISAVALSSRFPRLIIDSYTSCVRSISKHNAVVPANPMHVFGGDVWGQVDVLSTLCSLHRAQTANPQPSLEYDFFFWLINQQKLRFTMLYGDHLRIDSLRDVSRLLQVTGELP